MTAVRRSRVTQAEPAISATQTGGSVSERNGDRTTFQKNGQRASQWADEGQQYRLADFWR